MNFADYCALDATNWSSLKELRKSPLHYLYNRMCPREDTPRLAFGRACHTAVLEPDRFPLEYAVYKGARRAGADWKVFEQGNAGRTILKADEYELALGIRDAVRDHPVAGPLLSVGVPERTFKWDEHGIACKCRVDWIHGAYLVDLKTTTDVDAFKFGHDAARYGYHGQLAMYKAGAVANGYAADIPVYIIAVEIEPPFDVAVFEVDDDALYAGELLYLGLLDRLEQCQKSGQWPGRYQNLTPLQLPSWAWPRDTDEIGGRVVAGGI